MGKCECCGNKYENTFKVSMNGREHLFDSFECAIRTLAPECFHCGTKIIGHGVEHKKKVYCCAHCARAEGQTSLVDHSA